MNTLHRTWLALGRPNTAVRCAVLWLAALVPVVVALPFLIAFADAPVFVAAALAWMLCAVGATAALILSDAFSALRNPVAGLLGAMMVRFAVPLGGAMIVQLGSPVLREAGFVYALLVCYLWMLLAETLLMLARVQSTARHPTPGGSSPHGAQGI